MDDRELAAAAELAGWRVRNPGVLQVRPAAEGLELSAISSLFQVDRLRLLPPDAPVPLPVLDAAAVVAPVLDFASGDHVLRGRGRAAPMPCRGSAATAPWPTWST